MTDPDEFFITFDIQTFQEEVNGYGWTRHYQTQEAIVKIEMYAPLFKEMRAILEQQYAEEQVRKKNEVVNNAYEQYLILLKLAQ
jgi:hypothetical protein